MGRRSDELGGESDEVGTGPIKLEDDMLADVAWASPILRSRPAPPAAVNGKIVEDDSTVDAEFDGETSEAEEIEVVDMTSWTGDDVGIHVDDAPTEMVIEAEAVDVEDSHDGRVVL